MFFVLNHKYFSFKGLSGDRGPPGVIDLDRLRPLIIEITRELLPGGICYV